MANNKLKEIMKRFEALPEHERQAIVAETGDKPFDSIPMQEQLAILAEAEARVEDHTKQSEEKIVELQARFEKLPEDKQEALKDQFASIPDEEKETFLVKVEAEVKAEFDALPEEVKKVILDYGQDKFGALSAEERDAVMAKAGYKPADEEDSEEFEDASADVTQYGVYDKGKLVKVFNSVNHGDDFIENAKAYAERHNLTAKVYSPEKEEAAKIEKTVVHVVNASGEPIRTYALSVHGKDYEKLAETFVKKNGKRRGYRIK